MTSAERGGWRAKAEGGGSTRRGGKEGGTESLLAGADNQLTTRELVKGKVLEAAMMTPREVSDQICEALGAEGVSVIGTKFVIYRFSQKLQEERNQKGRAKRKAIPVSKSDPVRKGLRARRQAAKKQREQRNQYFRQMAIDKAIEKQREKQLHGE